MLPFVSAGLREGDGSAPRTEEDVGPAGAEGLAATLRALADNQPAFPGGEEGPDDLSDEFLEKIAAQLRGLEGFEGLLGEEDVGRGVGATAAGGGGGGVHIGGGSGGQEPGPGNFPGMASLVDTIMHQLLSKDVLYQPMKVSKGRV